MNRETEFEFVPVAGNLGVIRHPNPEVNASLPSHLIDKEYFQSLVSKAQRTLSSRDKKQVA